MKTIHAKAANRRSDFHHKLSTRIVREFDDIAVGNGHIARLARTSSMAKSVLEAGWPSFRTQLACKTVKHGAWFEEVSEALNSQACSNCGVLPDSRPRGIADLGTRSSMWSDRGCVHDRDVSAAKNILNKFASRAGHGTPAEGIPIP